jgi:hypothetical protein
MSYENEATIRTQAINDEFDRLGWSSDTAPDGASCLDAFETEQSGIVVVEDTQESTCFYGDALLIILQALPDEIGWDDLWQAILPAMVEA